MFPLKCNLPPPRPPEDAGLHIQKSIPFCCSRRNISALHCYFPPSLFHFKQAAAQAAVPADAATAVTPANIFAGVPTPPDCPDAGAESHFGCEDPIKGGTPFDLWELARSWTPGFCASGGKRTCAKKECAVSAMIPALTLHGMWPSFSKPVFPSSAATAAAAVDDATALAHHRRALRDVTLVTRSESDAAAVAAAGACFWPQDCTQPAWWPKKSPWAYDPSLLPVGPEYETLAPAWYSDG